MVDRPDAAIDRADVLKIAHLARLRLDDEEVGVFTRQLNAILSHAEDIAAAEAEQAAAAPGPSARAAAGRAAGSAESGTSPEHGGARELRLRAADASPDPLLRGPESFAPEFPEGLFAVPRLEAMDEEPAP